MAATQEWNDIYDENRSLTGRVHLRGTPWAPGDYGLVVCVWVYDGSGHILLTRRAKGKSFHGTWENSGGAAKAGETSRQAIARELFEETGLSLDTIEDVLYESYSAVGFSNEKNICVVGTASGEFAPSTSTFEEIEAAWYTKAQIRELLKDSYFAARTQAYCYMWSKW